MGLEGTASPRRRRWLKSVVVLLIGLAYLGGVYTAVRGTRVFRAFSASCLVSSLRDSYDPSIVSGEFAVMLPEDAPAEQATPIDW